MSLSRDDYIKFIATLVENNIEKIIKGLTKGIKERIIKTDIDYGIAFEEYLTNAFDKYSKIKTLLYRTEPKFLYDFFECNTLQYNNEFITPNEISNIVNINKFIIIQGTGGIGKSTLMKHLFLSALKANKQIPVFVELKDLNNEDNDLYKCIYNTLVLQGFHLDIEYFDYALKSGTFVFLLDGFDEIKNEKYSISLKLIKDFCDQFNKNMFIISSRPNDSFVSLQRFTVLNSLPFSKRQSLNLINKLDFDNNSKERFFKDLDKSLYEKHKSFASNPLLLNIMLLTYNNYAEIPEKLHIFYANAFETLYSKHDATKGGYKREMRCNLTYDNFTKVFAKFCFNTYIKREFTFTKEKIYENFKIILKNIGFEFNFSDYIYDLLNAICVLYEEGNVIGFTHRSFQEYFTALYIKELPDDLQFKACLYLIDSNNFFTSNENVSTMFYDMAKNRCENNVVLRLVNEILNNFDKDKDTYDEYLKILFNEVIFSIENNKVCLAYSIKSEDKNERAASLFWFVSVYDSFLGTEFNKEFDDEIRKVLLKIKAERVVYDLDEIFSRKDLYNYIKESWIGKRIYHVLRLKNELSEKYDALNKDLDDLLN